KPHIFSPFLVIHTLSNFGAVEAVSRLGHAPLGFLISMQPVAEERIGAGEHAVEHRGGRQGGFDELVDGAAGRIESAGGHTGAAVANGGLQRPAVYAVDPEL